MKKTILIGFSLLAINANAADSGAGCGFGTAIFDGQSGLAPHVLAATTNGSAGNQTFGMSTGTLGCQPTKAIDSLTSIYIENNINSIAVDFSKGQGESFDTLVKLLKIENNDVDAFSKLVKNNFAEIFPSENTTSVEVIENLASIMRKDAQLEAYVS